MTRSQKTHLKVLAVCFSVLILFFGGFTGGWFAHKNSKTEQQADTSAADAGGLVIQEEGESHGIALTVLQEPDADVAAPTAFDPTVENSLFDRAESYMNKKYTLTATATYSDTSGIGATEGLIWTCAFLNPDSDWARGKDPADYISLTGDTSTSRTAYRKNDFAEPIVIKVAAESHPERYATCQADCMQKIIALDCKFVPINNGFMSETQIAQRTITCIWDNITPIMIDLDNTSIGMGGRATISILEKSSVYTIPLDETKVTYEQEYNGKICTQKKPMIYAAKSGSNPQIELGAFCYQTILIGKKEVLSTKINIGINPVFSIRNLYKWGYNGINSSIGNQQLEESDFIYTFQNALNPQRPNKEKVVTNPFAEFAVQARYQNVYVGFFATQFEIAGIATL